MENNLVTIDITDNESLLDACDILHDAYCDLSTLHQDITNGVWKVRFEREFTENPNVMTHERKFIFFIKSTFPITDPELTLTGVKNCRIENKVLTDKLTFNECQIKTGVATLLFCEGIKIIVEFEESPQGKLVDLGLLEKTRTMWTTGVKEYEEKCQQVRGTQEL